MGVVMSKRRPRRAVVFAPYLHTLGGGERVIVRVAEILGSSHDVALYSPQRPDAGRWHRLGFPDVAVSVLDARQFMRNTAGVSLSVTLTNHVPLPSFARRALLIVQFPVDDLRTIPTWQRLVRRAVLRRYRVVTYSQFNADHIAQRWGRRGVAVLAPPVTQYPYDPHAKKHVILSVGRFGTSGGHKRHDVLLEAWASLRPRLPGWQLVLAGGGADDGDAVRELRVRAAEIGDVVVHVDASPELLATLYGAASIYWHAAGYGRDESHPELAEHFGMSTVEAMSAGAVPIVFADGGQVEIVAGTHGRCWTTIDELVELTASLAADPARLSAAAANVSVAARRYDAAVFRGALLTVVGR
jgi:glycosyltransferase involved in cell wall biosynthesis